MSTTGEDPLRPTDESGEERTVINVREEECGCEFTEFAEGPPNLFPCLAHCFVNMAKMLEAAGQRFANAHAQYKELEKRQKASRIQRPNAADRRRFGGKS